MSLRSSDSLAKQLRDAILDLDELKEAQFVGEDQIKIQETVSSTVVAPSESSFYEAEANATCIVESADRDNVLITYAVAEVYDKNGVLITNKFDGLSVSLTTIDTGLDYTNAYQANIFRSSTGGEEVFAENFTVKFHVWSSADVTLTARNGIYG